VAKLDLIVQGKGKIIEEGLLDEGFLKNEKSHRSAVHFVGRGRLTRTNLSRRQTQGDKEKKDIDNDPKEPHERKKMMARGGEK